MITIYKYPITPTDKFEVSMPFGATILTVQMQYGDPFMWAMVNTDLQDEVRTFEVIGTGNPMPQLHDVYSRSYINTFQLYGGRLVVHLFELTS